MDAGKWIKRAFAPECCGRSFSYCFFNVLKLLFWSVTAILMLFAALPRSRVDLAAADADDLLLRLTALGGEGAAVLCSPDRVEQYLSVQIEKGNLKRSDSDTSPVAVNASNQSVSGNYWKFKTSAGTVCRLQLQIAGRRFCDADSARTQRLIGRRAQTQLAVPGEAGFYDHGYELARNSREVSVIGWREPSRSCPANVEIAVAIR